MPYTKLALQNLHSLSLEDVDATLNACGLPIDQDQYTESEIQSGFDVIRGYFTSGQAPDYTVAAELFHQNIGVTQPQKVSPTKAKKSGKALKPTQALDISFLLSQAFEQSGKSISLIEALKILEACGLPDTEEYTQQQCDRFLKACDLIEQQHKSYEEVALYFGLSLDEDMSDSLVQDLDEAADLIESNISFVTDEMMQQRARGQALTDSQRYLSYYLQELKEGQAVQDFWTRLREHAKARLSGKPQARLKRAEPQTTLTLPPESNSMNSSKSSENGTTNE